jgi:hypothetical protein
MPVPPPLDNGGSRMPRMNLGLAAAELPAAHNKNAIL